MTNPKMYTLHVKIDQNDMDFTTTSYQVSSELLAKLTPLFMKLNKLRTCWEWDVEEYDLRPMKTRYLKEFTGDEFDLLTQYIPMGEYGYTRSVESVVAIPQAMEIKIL